MASRVSSVAVPDTLRVSVGAESSRLASSSAARARTGRHTASSITRVTAARPTSRRETHPFTSPYGQVLAVVALRAMRCPPGGCRSPCWYAFSGLPVGWLAAGRMLAGSDHAVV